MAEETKSHSQREGSNAASRGLALKASKVVVAALVVVTLVVLMLMEPAVPDRISLFTGPEGSPYHELGERYASELGVRGLTVEVLSTDGDLDNMRRLTADGDNAIAFAPSIVGMAIDSQFDTSALVSYGSIGFAPLWLFHRSDLRITHFAELVGHELATVGSGSVSDALARRLLELHGIADEVTVRSSDQAAPGSVVDALATGTLDAVFLSGSPQSALVQRLLHAPGVSLLSFEHAAAYAARLPSLAILEAPQGVFDLARNIPGSNSKLVGAATNLVAGRSLHPAVAPVVLGVAADLGAGSNTFFQASFPSEEHLAFPLAASARRFFQQGETGLSKYLPYSVSRYLNHLGFLVLPTLTILVLLLKLVPMVLKGIGRLRLVGLYRQLEQIDRASVAAANEVELLADLDRLDATTATMFVPRVLAPEYVNFRQALYDLGERVQSR